MNGIELPPVKPHVTQVRPFGGRGACCGERVTADAPAGLERRSSILREAAYAFACGAPFRQLCCAPLPSPSPSDDSERC
jgi:hypothetical protein